MKKKLISVAPMIDKTDRHFRYFMRGITKEALLYTEMVTAQSIIRGNRNLILDFNPIEKPLALQLAASNVEELVEAVQIAKDWDYDEINLNIGCPSDRVSGNHMGAVLMAYPYLVRDMIKATKENTNKKVTVKHRIGIDGKGILDEIFERTLFDSYEDLKNFVDIIMEAKPDRLIIHARIAILAGLSPKENREIPPIRYEEVYKLKEEYPNIEIEINGGIKTEEQIDSHLEKVEGVMIGREAYDNPYFMRIIDKYYGKNPVSLTREEIALRMIPYIEEYEKKGGNPNSIIRHMLGLFHGVKGAKAWKNALSSVIIKELGGKEAVLNALRIVSKY